MLSKGTHIVFNINNFRTHLKQFDFHRFKVIGVVTVCGGIYLIVGFDEIDAKFNLTFDKAKTNIRSMIKGLFKS